MVTERPENALMARAGASASSMQNDERASQLCAGATVVRRDAKVAPVGHHEATGEDQPDEAPSLNTSSSSRTVSVV